MRLLALDRRLAMFVVLLVPIAAAAFGGCGGDSPSSSSTGGTGGSTTTSGGTGGSTTTSSGTGGSTTTSAGTGGGSVACGASLLCAPGEVCIVDEMDAPCSPAPEDGGACPPGTVENKCGGIGYPCCCGQAPPSEFRCASALSCAGAPSCDCLVAVCKDDKMCLGQGGKPDEFHCVTPPQP
ncbi:MAG: hypothetical protein U0359_18765 [Byssovorax sp.]